MSWLDRISPASFRGLEFLTESHDSTFGRRLPVHEYPGSEVPSSEDLGAKAWDGKLNAYFIGPDYDLPRNALLAKLAEAGPSWLMHPWLGLRWVRAKSWTLHESNDRGGFCTVAIEFVEGGDSAQPTTDQVDLAITRCKSLALAAVDDFTLEPMSAAGLAAFIGVVQQRLEVLRQAISLATLPLSWAAQIRGVIAGIKGDMAALLAIPDAYATAFHGLANDLGLGSDRDDVADTDRPRLVAQTVSAATSGSSVALSGAASADGAVRRNLVREDALRQRLLVTSAMQIALADYRAEVDRDAALASAVGGIDALLPALPDTVFELAVAARTALIDALLAQDLKPASTRDVLGPLPAVVLAHRLSITESVFLARNKVRHPLFVTGRVYG